MPPAVSALCAFPWDFADKGIDETLTRVSDLGVTHLFLAVSYHAGYFFYPDNPRRRTHLLEDGVVYFHAQPDFYRDTPLKPQIAAMCAERDWVEAVAARLDPFGLHLGAWTVCLHNSRLGLLHPDCTVRSALGDSYPHALSPADPRVQAYVLGMVRELVSRYPVSMLMLEATDYRGRRHGGDWVAGHHHERDGILLAPLEQALLDISFAAADLRAAAAEGIDGIGIRERVATHLRATLAAYPARAAGLAATLAEFEAAHPDVAAYRACLRRQAQGLVAQIKAETASAGVELVGAPDPSVDWLLAGAYGKTPVEIEQLTRENCADALPHQKVMVGIRLGFNPPPMGAVHSQVQLERSVAAAQVGGAGGLLFYNLAESPGRELAWIGPALRSSSPVSSRPLRLGLIGCGGISEAYLRAAWRLADVEIVALADTDPEQAERRARQFGIETVRPDAASLLALPGLDGVIIATPPHTHAELLRVCLQSPAPILLEKPLAPTLLEADSMVDAVQSTGRIVGIGLVHRYLPCYRAIRDLMLAGALGRVRQIRLRTGRELYPDPRFRQPDETRGGWLTRPDIAGGGILMSSTIHLLSVCNFLLQETPVRRVAAQARRLHPDAYAGIEDDVTLFAWAEEGTELQIEDSWAREWPFELELWGDGGRVRATAASWAGSVVLTGTVQGPLPPPYAELASAGGFTANAARFDHLCPPLFEGLLADFAQSLRTGAPTGELPTILHARNMQAAVAACYRSAAEHATAPVAWRGPHAIG